MIDLEKLKNTRPSFNFMSGENRKKIIGIVSVIAVLIVTSLVIFFLGRNQDTRSRAATGDPVNFYLDPGGAIAQKPGDTFTASLYLDTGNNNITAVAPVITTSDPSILKIVSFAPAPAGASPYLSEVVLNNVDATGSTLHYIVVNKSINNVSSSSNLLIGTITLQAVSAGNATLKMDIGTAATDATIYDSKGDGLPIQNFLANTNLATLTIASPTIAEPACNVSFTFPSTPIHAGDNVPVTVTFNSPAASDAIWQYSDLQEEDANGNFAQNFGGCSGQQCTFLGPQNTVGRHYVAFHTHDETTYGAGKKMAGQTGDSIKCAVTGNNYFDTVTASPTNLASFPPPAGWTGPAVTYTLSPQNPKVGDSVTITISGRDDKGQSLNDVALVYNGQSLPQSWASGGSGGDGTTWTYTFPSSQTIQMMSCSYASTDPLGGPNCASGIPYNSATIQVAP